MTARAPDKEPSPRALLGLYETMLMARAIELRLWVLDHLEDGLPPRPAGNGFPPAGNRFPPRRAGRWREAPVGTLAPALGFEVVQVAALAALRPRHDGVVTSAKDLALCLAVGLSPLDVMRHASRHAAA